LLQMGCGVSLMLNMWLGCTRTCDVAEVSCMRKSFQTDTSLHLQTRI
jgi:hypothetical protein